MVERNDWSGMLQQIKASPDIPLETIVDEKGYSLVHKAALSSMGKMVKILVEGLEKYYKSVLKLDENKSVERLEKFLNRQNSEGFTPLHFASFRGNVEIIDFLIKKGADYRIVNSQGLSVVHLAAQGDQPKSLCYFRRFGNIEEGKVSETNFLCLTPI